MNILGISSFYHDAAAAVIMDGQLIQAVQEERFTRRKHDADFPKHSIESCLRQAGISIKEVDAVGFYDKPLSKFERLLFTYLSTFPRSISSFLKAMPVWMKEKLWVRQIIKKELKYTGPVYFSEHHISHAASCFLVSPFDEAAILTVDGVGEWDTTTYGFGRGNEIQLLQSIHFPHSLGLLYSAFTYYLGFKVNDAEYKVMGLAPYGRPVYYDVIMSELMHIYDDSSFKLNMKYFGFDYGLTMTNKEFEKLFGTPRREPESDLTQFHKDVAASLQKVTSEIMVSLANRAYKETKSENLCMAGGVALNCVANSEILRKTPFKHIFVQPAASDAGGAVGVAYYVYNTILGNKRNYVWKNAFLGPEYSDEEIEQYLRSQGVSYRRLEREQLLSETARIIASQNVVGWFQGRMEWGPRALGNRSILADARNKDNWAKVNLKIKFRESFRPFAPTVLLERARDYFDLDRPSPYMLLVANVREDKKNIPAVTHVDGSARLQTIAREDNPLFYGLIAEFERMTGCPVMVNTSFNVRGEPIVCTPDDAFQCFMRTEMDALAAGSFLLEKEKL
jgi:carbamoyltransferase